MLLSASACLPLRAQEVVVRFAGLEPWCQKAPGMGWPKSIHQPGLLRADGIEFFGVFGKTAVLGELGLLHEGAQALSFVYLLF